MSEIKRVGDLEIEEDLNFQHHSWKIERIGWVMMFLLVLAELLGLLGSGPLSKAIVGSKNGPLSIEYKRFERFRTVTELRFYLNTDTAGEEREYIWFNRDYLREIEIHEIAPTPDRVELRSDRVTYVFRTTDRHRPALIKFSLEPMKIGILHGMAGLNNDQALVFSQYVYP
ncbi:MAG: hypothetical protein AB1489_37860 [Acidobacteriota bacterium]